MLWSAGNAWRTAINLEPGGTATNYHLKLRVGIASEQKRVPSQVSLLRESSVPIDFPNSGPVFVCDQGTSQVVSVVVTAGLTPLTDSSDSVYLPKSVR